MARCQRETLSRYFSNFLDSSPSPGKYFKKLLKLRNFSGQLLVDGTYFNDMCLIIYKDAKTKDILYWRFANGEYKTDVSFDILFLVTTGYPLVGVTSDWKKAIVKAVELFKVPHQRCLVHTERLVRSLTTKKPKTEAGKELQDIVRYLNRIDTPYEQDIWLKWLHRWCERHEDFLTERTYSEDGSSWWYTHKKIRRARNTLISDTASLFMHLYQDIPKDTNGLEGFFSQFVNKINIHRGMTSQKRELFIGWFLYLRQFPDAKWSKKPTRNVT